MVQKYTILCMQTYTKMLTFAMSIFCVLNVHKFVDEGCVHTDVYTNVYHLYTFFLTMYVDCNTRIQGAGVGGLRHNTVLLGWPNNWRQGTKSYKAFIGKFTTFRNFKCVRMCKYLMIKSAHVSVSSPPVWQPPYVHPQRSGPCSSLFLPSPAVTVCEAVADNWFSQDSGTRIYSQSSRLL